MVQMTDPRHGTSSVDGFDFGIWLAYRSVPSILMRAPAANRWGRFFLVLNTVEMLRSNPHTFPMEPLPPAPIHCPHCGVKYEVVRVEASNLMEHREVTCLSCGGPLPAREDTFLMKYFLVDRPSQRQRRTK
jgi:hypothetical protein